MGDHQSTQAVGITRTKCGRSDIHEGSRSDSMSCSDKILKWNSLGLQGTLLSHLLPARIWLSSISVELRGDGEEDDLRVLRRGMLVRERGGSAKKANEPVIVGLRDRFEWGRVKAAGGPCGQAMAWNVAESPKVTTIIGKAGLKQGANIKNAKAFKSFRTDICRLELFKLHQDLVK